MERWGMPREEGGKPRSKGEVKTKGENGVKNKGEKGFK